MKSPEDLLTRVSLVQMMNKSKLQKQKKITPTTAPFEYESLGSKLHSITECLNANIYKTVDCKVKVITKSQNRKKVVQSKPDHR